MDVLAALGSFLASEGVVTGEAIDYFMDFMPDLPARLVAAYEDPAGPPRADGTYESAVQLSVRDTSAEAARSSAWAIYELVKLGGFTISNRRYTTRARGVPRKLAEDAAGRTVYSFNLTILA